MKINNGKATDYFLEFLDVWCSRDAQAMNKLESFIDDEFMGFGSAKHEVHRNSVEVFEEFKKEALLFPGRITIQTHWIKEITLNAKTSIIAGEFKVVFHLEGENVEIETIRITSVLRIRNEHYTIVNFHISVPDVTGEEEIFPGSAKPKTYEEISVLFTDFVGFTQIASSIPAKKLVEELNDLFTEFDKITTQKGISKIKTIGDSYMAAGGLKDPSANHAIQCIDWSKQVLKYLKKRNEYSGIKWEIRIGIHTGSSIGGIIGKENKTFDLWGDTINIASRLEKQSLPNKINVSAYTYELIKDNCECEYRGKIDIKGKGSIDMYFVK
ncbi:MAG: nuclear transport factor 2 family protein [Cyclobacteriaceae bacterium]|nr:nuclear transport factor 2 family protein [Cyclobacteriaceae bacterium]